MKPAPPPVRVAADTLALEVIQPERIKAPEVTEQLRSLAPDLLVVVAYGQIIPASMLYVPRLGAVNVHASLLPLYRGAAPVAHSILSGDRDTGVTIMRMDEKLDHGPILAVRKTAIGEGEDAAALTRRLAVMGADLLVETLERLDQITPIEQDHSRATLAPRLRREDGELDWNVEAAEIDRRVRGLHPWPGVTMPTKSGLVKILSGHVEGDRYVPDVMQLPGKKPAPAKQVLRDA